MLDFLMISTRSPKKDVVEIFPKFMIKKSEDLMIRGGDFYAIWDEERGLWSTDENDVVRLIDRELEIFAQEHRSKYDGLVKVMHMWDSDTGMIDKWHKYCQRQSRDSYSVLDEKLVFSNALTNKKDYASRRLNYPLEEGSISAWDKIISTLYTPEERHKIEWAIGSIVTGDSKKIQKFMVLYGAAGTGKSTILNIIQKLFEGYYSVFDAKALGSSSNAFALEAFKNNPLVAIQHDGDLSKIEDNTRLNSLVSHEEMTINEKFKSTYTNQFKCFLFMGTNRPVKITDGKSGLLRRLIDVTPSGNKLSLKEYQAAMKQVDFELGAIANHCKEVYLSDPGKYDSYIPMTMLGASNDFYNFVLDSYHVFKKEDGTTLKAAWEMYKTYCDDAKVPYPFSQRIFKEELKNYFWDYNDRFNTDDGARVRSYYSGFRTEQFEETVTGEVEAKPDLIRFTTTHSLFDEECSDFPAQYATSKETPSKKWENVKTKLSDIDTRQIHYVKVPENHIVIDFDIPDKYGNKCFEKNVEEASKWPPTYAELSKSGAGVHLHYIYTGDASKLSRIYDDHIEVKVFTGNSSLRRRLTKCNNLPIASISSGLPLKGDKNMVNFDGIKNEKGIRTLIKRNLNKEYHAATKPSIDFIHKILEEAYNDGVKYDVSDMYNAVLAFGASSSNQSDYCIKLVNKMKFKSEEPSEYVEGSTEAPIVFFDIECFPNLFLVNWKFQGKDKPVVRMINPTPAEIEEILRFRLVGFNNRNYDNHMLYAAYMGYDNEQLFKLSNRIINDDKDVSRKAKFGEAYNLSFTDIYDFASTKQSLKKWEVELGITHVELGLPWDQPVPQSLWTKVAEYCDNDVLATEALFEHLEGDWTARQILADLAGMTVNDTTNTLTTRIIFGKEKNPNLVYTDLATGKRTDGTKDIASFPEYEFVWSDKEKRYCNMYRGVDVGFGGYVYAEPGIHGNVALLDVASMHPNSIRAMNCFGEYTKNFTDILDARVAIKHGDYDLAKQMFNGRLAKYLTDKATAKALSQALKIAINSVYGLTSAGFDNPFRDVRNKNNIVALRGALFMKTLQDEVAAKGYTVVHVKTDSIKIADATPEIIDFVMKFGEQYGYTFEHEATYDKMCLVNNAVYIAKYSMGGEGWTATGKEFAVPYLFKNIFSKEPITFEDLCEVKTVKTAIELDMNEKLPEGEHDYHFVGRVGNFCPIKPGCGGGLLVRQAKDKDGNLKYDAVVGTKGYRWLEAERVKDVCEQNIDRSYYDKLVDEAIDAIAKYGDVEWFISDDPYEGSELQLTNTIPF